MDKTYEVLYNIMIGDVNKCSMWMLTNVDCESWQILDMGSDKYSRCHLCHIGFPFIG